jgi:hypothetical protein
MSTYFVSVSAGDHKYRKRLLNLIDAINHANHLLALYRKPRRACRFGDGYIRIEGIDYNKVVAIAMTSNFI